MTIPAASLKYESNKGRFKGSLTGTLVRTLLIFTFIPLALMAGAAYFRARNLLREQAIYQLENLMANQVRVVSQDVQFKENLLKEKIERDNAAVVIEAALHANPQSSQFRSIRSNFFKVLFDSNSAGEITDFDEFLLVDTDGIIRLATQPEWQGIILDPTIANVNEDQSRLLQELAPLYEGEPVLLTIISYKTARGSNLGVLIGVTKGDTLQELLQPLNGLAPYANTYFVLSGDQIISVNPESGVFSPTTIEDSAEMQLRSELDAMKGQENPVSTALDVELTEETSVLAQVQWLPSIQSGVVLAIESETIFEHVNSLTPFTILLALGTLGAMGVFLYYGTRRVIKPLKSLSEATRKFAEGDWSQRAEATHADNEIGLLSNSFNYLADQIEDSYKSLERKVEERTLQIRTAAEVAQSITTIPDLDEMLSKTVELLVQQFDFYQTAIFLVDRSRKNVDFKAGYGSGTKSLLERKYSLPISSASIVGWVAANNKVRVASDVTEDELHLQNEFLPETRSEASVPISLGNHVLGVLDVQSTQPGAFSPDAILMLQTLASQIAAAMQTAGLVEASQINFEELDRLYRSSRLIEEAKDEVEILRVGGQILRSAPYPIVLFRLSDDNMKAVTVSDMIRNDAPASLMQNGIQVDTQELTTYLLRGSVSTVSTSAEMPKPFKDILHALDLMHAVILPVKGQDSLHAVIIIGSRQQSLSSTSMQPYENLADLMSVAIQRANAVAQMEKHLQEVEALASMNELISSSSDIQEFFRALLTKIQQIIGDYSLVVAIYDEPTNSISIPFSYENGRVQAIPTFPLGEGLTSILIRTRQPLMLVKDTERRAAELGAKIVGKPARSWMGAPMILQGSVIGALIIQDTDHEGAFDEDNLKFFTTIASQVAGVIKNVQLLEESKQKALQVETAAEIARDISGSLNLDELLGKAVSLIRERFNFYHAGIFLLDLPGEFAIIREATGEAGAQMKRQGYKIGVGSKSIVGYVTGKGETLVVSDTAKDLTYYPNPLLPDTRAEAAFPLRVGDRILGALDVQSTQPYAFHEDNLRSLQILADQLAIAVANTELFAETQEHLSQHRLLHHITSSAASGTTLEEALESAVSGLQVTLGGDRVMIFLVDRDKHMLELKASMGYSEDITNMKVELGKGVTGWVASHRRPLRLRDVREDPRYIETSANTRSELAIPLIYRNEILGVINVESEQTDAYSENDEEMLGTLGGSLAAVIANARLVEQIRAQSERERLINEITAKIRRSTDIQSILHTTASELARVTGARYTKIEVEPKTSAASEERQ
ncbi:MAG: GAF domain-containing protein [Chloroflexi bacterium]|nr:GAF domain-containing protein [Chloroflexota bacterium]